MWQNELAAEADAGGDFEQPTRSDIEWSAIESLVVALGGEITEGSGSRVRLSIGGLAQSFHRPHPQRVTSKGAAESARALLRAAGHAPEEDA